jgi:hypothetical protein
MNTIRCCHQHAGVVGLSALHLLGISLGYINRDIRNKSTYVAGAAPHRMKHGQWQFDHPKVACTVLETEAACRASESFVAHAEPGVQHSFQCGCPLRHLQSPVIVMNPQYFRLLHTYCGLLQPLGPKKHRCNTKLHKISGSEGNIASANLIC